ncbi:MAG TPA: hypothetical protein VIU45_08020 [Chitinophagaceae bacterium]
MTVYPNILKHPFIPAIHRCGRGFALGKRFLPADGKLLMASDATAKSQKIIAFDSFARVTK